MNIQINNQVKEGNYIRVELKGKRNEVHISHDVALGYVTVVVNNAVHQAWRGPGKTYGSWNSAKSAYKSSEMKAMLEYAEQVAV
jgi:uncharacterized protein involved in outer membrane biogenesis